MMGGGGGGGGPPRGAPGGGARGAGNSMRPMGRGDYGELFNRNSTSKLVFVCLILILVVLHRFKFLAYVNKTHLSFPLFVQ